MKNNNEIIIMKKKLFLILIVCFTAFDAYAEELITANSLCYQNCKCNYANNLYAKIWGGANFLQNTNITDNKSTYQTGYVVSGSVGWGFCNGFCLEAEYAFRRNAIKKIHFFGEGQSKHGHFQASSFMGNLIWDLPVTSWGCQFQDIQPYVGVGIGYDFQQMQSSNSRIIFKQKWNHFSWQVMTGVAYPIFCNTDITLEYKFHQGGSHFNNHSLGVGLVYKFNL